MLLLRFASLQNIWFVPTSQCVGIKQISLRGEVGGRRTYEAEEGREDEEVGHVRERAAALEPLLIAAGVLGVVLLPVVDAVLWAPLFLQLFLLLPFLLLPLLSLLLILLFLFYHSCCSLCLFPAFFLFPF